MLTRSPVPARSSNASPSAFHAFRYAPAAAAIAAVVPSPHQSPRVPPASSRRPSSLPSPSAAAPPAAMTPPLPKTPSQSRPATYVAVDAATQYSPMEPVDYTAPRRPSAAVTTQTPLDPPPRPAPKAMTLDGDDGEPSSQLRRGSGSPPPQEQPQTLRAPHPMSPNKRRNSEAVPGGSAVASRSAAAQKDEAQSKRARPDTPPPKVVPERYELCPVEDMVVLIANMLSELIETNDALALKSGHLTRFHSRTAPGISVLDYLHRLAKHATLTPPLLLSMVYYIDRLCALYPDFTINTLTVHRFLITAATVAAKGLSDSFWNNSTYARVGGVRVAELKLLELEFLYRVDWKIVPNPEVLVAYYRGLVERSPAYVLQGEEAGGEVERDGEDDDEEDDELDDESNGSAPKEAPSPKEEGGGNG